MLEFEDKREYVDLEDIEFSDEFYDKALNHFDNEENYISWYWDYRDELTEEQIKKILEEPDGYTDVEEEILEWNQDYIWELEHEALKEYLKDNEEEVMQEIQNWIDANPGKLIRRVHDKTELSDILRELSSNLRHNDIYPYVNFEIDSLLHRQNVNVIISTYSDYDCINSHFFETGGTGQYEFEENYFTDMVKVLKLNPKKVGETMGYERETLEQIPERDDSERLVSYEDFKQEMENNSTPAGLLVFIGTLDLGDLITTYKKELFSGEGKALKDLIKKVIIPKGNTCGIYSSFSGGGSLIEMELIRDFEIDLSKTDEYPHFGLSFDNSRSSYSINGIYGPTQAFWGDEITIVEA